MVVCRTVPKPILRVIYYLLTAKSMGNAISYRDPITKKTKQKSTCIGRYNPDTKEITPTDGRMKKAAEKKQRLNHESLTLTTNSIYLIQY